MREMLFFPLIWVKLLLATRLADFDDVGGNLFLPLIALTEMSVCAVMHASWVKSAGVILTDPDLTRR